MLPLKWKIFRIMTYLHMTITAVLAGLAIVTLAETKMRFRSFEDLLVILIIFVVPGILLSNSSINILLLEKYYPERQPGKVLIRFSILLFILTSIIILATLAVGVFGLYDVFFGDSTANTHPLEIVMALAITTIGLTGCYILWTQVSLRKVLRQNHDSTINNFLADDEL